MSDVGDFLDEFDDGRYSTLRRMKIVKFDDERKAEFLEIYSQCFNLSKTAQAVGISYRCMDEHRRKDPDFARALEDVKESGVDELIAEGRRRAFDGVDEPVFHQGQICGYKKRYSDQLLMFLVKGHRPEFRDNKKIESEIYGKDGGAIENKWTVEVVRPDASDSDS